MKHRQVQKLIPWYLNETLSERERTAVERHLQRCSGCREELSWWSEMADRVAGQPSLPISDALPNSLLDRLDQEPGRSQPVGVWRPALAFVAVLILLVAILELPSTQLQLEWTAGNAELVDSFSIYRSRSAGQPEELVYSSPPEQLQQGGGFSYTDLSVRPNTPYYYWLEAKDNFGASTITGPIPAVAGGTLFAAKLLVGVCLLGALAVGGWSLRPVFSRAALFSF